MRRLVILCCGLGLLLACGGTPPSTESGDRSADTASPGGVTTRLSAVDILGDGRREGYAAALAPRVFAFPADHGPHPDFKTEWWYFTGHLEGEGRRFGYQLTFFRQALAPDMPERSSTWATRQVYLAHFALSDLENDTFHAFERLSRGAAGLAGAGGSKPFHVWLEDWSVESTGDSTFPVRLQARVAEAPTLELDLLLEAEKPPVLHGDGGLSRKGTDPGNASYYYSLTRITSRGNVRLDEREIPVSGSSWLDREWSTSVLQDDQTGWDWFSLQLDDGRELMVFQLRREDGGIDPVSHGTVIGVDGTTRSLGFADFELEVLDTWRSRQGVIYPAGWRLQVPSESLALTLEPLMADQELDVSFRYWEGALGISGSASGKQIRGRGFAELVGYDG